MWHFLRIPKKLFIALFAVVAALPAEATTYYVNINCANPTPPYTDWSTAATNIQNAVDSASPGDLVLVTNGIYSGGGRTAFGSATNCVVITNSITVQSVNGPSATIIQAFPAPWTTNGLRGCVYLGTNSTLSGFTLMNGTSSGINCQYGNSIVTNCIITENSGSAGGGYGGSYYDCIISNNAGNNSAGGVVLINSGASMNNCVIIGNSSRAWVGGVSCVSGTYLINCTVANNSVTELGGGGACGGVFGGSLTNCIVYYNISSHSEGTNIAESVVLNNCCVTPTNGFSGNNIASAPGFVNIDAGNLRLAQWSPCIDAGTNVVAGSIDLDGNPRIVNGTVDIGAYEYQYPPAITVHFVTLDGATPASPYTNWATAATNIQVAIEASAPGDFVVVSNGLYNTGTKTNIGMIGNRIAVDVPVTVQGLAGNSYTQIRGNYPQSPSIRCAYLTNGATLIGLTLTNGYSTYTGNPGDGDGGGAWCQSTSATLINCAFLNNVGYNRGGGAYSGTLISCTLSNNGANFGGGTFSATLINCTLMKNGANIAGGASLGGVLTNCNLIQNGADSSGGGASSNTLYNCTLTQNSSSGKGGGAYSSILNNCSLSGNWATNNGGGVSLSTLTNCVLTGNWATNGGGSAFGLLVNCTLTNNSAVDGGGSASNTLYNCLLAGNTATTNGGGAFYSTLTNCTVLQNIATNCGGGVFGGTMENCLISSNVAGARGGGACYATLSDCLLMTNVATYGGGSASNTLNNCTAANNRANLFGGGTYSGAQNDCLISNNIALQGGGGSAFGSLTYCSLFNNTVFNGPGVQGGGGAFRGTLISCLISNNIAYANGGGALNAVLTNCLIVYNTAPLKPPLASGGGTYNCYVANCTVMYNTNRGVDGNGLTASGATNSIIYYNTVMDVPFGSFRNCCVYSSLVTNGVFGNITNAPLLVNPGSDFRLQSASPCINSGSNSFVSIATDLDGNPRIQGGTVDIGAYEYQTPTSVISYAYLQQYGLPTDGSVDFEDLAGTGLTVYQDWLAGINPTNAAAGLILFTPRSAGNPTNNATGIIVSWQSAAGIPYNLQRSTNLTAQPPFSTIQSNIVGTAGTTTYTDSSATNDVPYFYRVSAP
jgi:hypothetical protein